MTIYWVTQSFGTSARYYYEAAHNQWKPSHNRKPVVEAPTGIAVFLKEVMLMPRKWAERYYNLKRWTVMPSGGHFAPMEEPERLVEDVRAFFRPLRLELATANLQLIAIRIAASWPSGRADRSRAGCRPSVSPLRRWPA